MSLQTKLLSALISLALIPLAVFGMIAYSRSTTTLSGVEQEDLRGAVDSVDRAFTLIKQDILRTIPDYSNWDELQKQISSDAPDQKFLDDNFGLDAAASVLSIHHLTTTGIWNKAGKSIYGVGQVDTITKQIPDILTAGSAISDPQVTFTIIDKEVYIITWAPILNNAAQDPQGVLMIGRPLSSADTDQLKALTGHDVALYTGNQQLAASQDPKVTLTPSTQDLQSAALGQQVLNLNDAGTALGYQPIKDAGGKPVATIVVWQSRATINAAQSSILGVLLPAFVIMAVLAFIVAFALRGSIAKPLIDIAHSADQIAGGDLSQRVPMPKSHDELERLAKAFNRMADTGGGRVGASEAENLRLRAQDEYRLKLLTEVTEAIQAPISEIQMAGQTLDMEMYGALNEPQRASVQAIRTAIGAEQTILNDLLDYSRAQRRQLQIKNEGVALDALLSESAATASKQYAGKFIELQQSIPAGLPSVSADRKRIRQALDLSLDWMFELIPPRGTLTLSAAPNGKQVEVSIAGSGKSLSEEEQSKLFDLFYYPRHSAQEKRHNAATGSSSLGLAFIRALLEQQGGTLDIRPQPGVGNTLTLRVPIVGAAGD